MTTEGVTTGFDAIAAAFAAEGRRAAFMPYMMGGFPDMDVSRRIAEAYADGGADLVELGFPYSDPLADGPVIHAAGTAALRAGATTHEVLAVGRGGAAGRTRGGGTTPPTSGLADRSNALRDEHALGGELPVTVGRRRQHLFGAGPSARLSGGLVRIDEAEPGVLNRDPRIDRFEDPTELFARCYRLDDRALPLDDSVAHVPSRNQERPPTRRGLSDASGGLRDGGPS